MSGDGDRVWVDGKRFVLDMPAHSASCGAGSALAARTVHDGARQPRARDVAESFPVSRSGGRPATIAIYMHDLSGGGVERQSLALATELQMLGFDITLVLHQMRGELRDQLSPQLRTVDLDSSRTIKDIPRLASFLSREKPDVLLANVDHNNVAALLAKALAASRTKVVICQHNPISSEFYQGLSWTYRGIPTAYRAAAPLIARAVGVSRGIARELETIAHLPPGKVVTINNPVIGPDFAFRSGESVSHPWLEERSTPVFVCAGRAGPAKGSSDPAAGARAAP